MSLEWTYFGLPAAVNSLTYLSKLIQSSLKIGKRTSEGKPELNPSVFQEAR